MTGVGVNDVLAIREADCSIAMAEGSDAARPISHSYYYNKIFFHGPK
jgi:cation-transporting ATPase E